MCEKEIFPSVAAVSTEFFPDSPGLDWLRISWLSSGESSKHDLPVNLPDFAFGNKKRRLR
jgi:hypothetical protein